VDALSPGIDSTPDRDSAILKELERSDDIRAMLEVICRTTGMGFAAVAHVTQDRWVACQVRDEIAFGLEAGGELPIRSTLCDTVRSTGEAIVIDEVARDPVYHAHHTPATYGLQSYIAVPITLADGAIFGTLCAIDPQPRRVDTPETRGMFALFAQLVGIHVDRIRLTSESRDVRESNAYLTALLAASPDNVIVLGADGRVELMNERGLSLAQLDTVEQIRGRDFASLWPEDEQDKVRAAMASTTVEEPGSYEAYGPTGKGEPRWWSVSFAAFRSPDGARKLIAVLRDITTRVLADQERERVAQQLLHLNQTLEQRVAAALAEKKVYADIVESSAASVTALDLDFQILAINRANVEAFAQVYGKRPQVGDNFLALFEGTPDHRAQQHAIWSRALEGETFVVVQEFGNEQIDRRYYEVRFYPLFDRAGTRIGASSTSYDVTDRIKAEQQLATAQEQLRQSQKMEAMGQLTGGVAHDFNNLLTPIVGLLDLLQERSVGSEREQRLIAGAAQSAERARTLVQRLLAFARRQPLQPSAVDVAALVTGIADLIATTTGPQIKLYVTLADALPSAHADPNQLEMALLNLGVNARDAMPDGGTLRISGAVETVEEGHATSLPLGRYVHLAVADTGSGMDEETRKRAIEPFFSTKGVGKGTGLGLSMVHGLMEQLGGALTLESSLGVGTEVGLWLPVSAQAVEVERPDVEAPRSRGTGLILLVDDEYLVRFSTADMLGELGYEVAEAASAEEALALIENGLEPDLVVTDHLMPGLSGTELARRLSQERPGLPTLIISGYAGLEGLAPEFERLTKPFRRDELRARVATLCGAD